MCTFKSINSHPFIFFSKLSFELYFGSKLFMQSTFSTKFGSPSNDFLKKFDRMDLSIRTDFKSTKFMVLTKPTDKSNLSCGLDSNEEKGKCSFCKKTAWQQNIWVSLSESFAKCKHRKRPRMRNVLKQIKRTMMILRRCGVCLCL